MKTIMTCKVALHGWMTSGYWVYGVKQGGSNSFETSVVQNYKGLLECHKEVII